MTDRIEEIAYKWPRRYVFIATLVTIVAILGLAFLV
jgi:hypothetical protein